MLILSMIAGGCSGSTQGGIKLVGLLVLLWLIQFALGRSAARHGRSCTCTWG